MPRTSIVPIHRNMLVVAKMIQCSALALLVLLFASALVAQTTTTIVPSSYTTTSGSSGNEPIASTMDILDESGFTSVVGKYVSFFGSTNVYAGYRVYTLPSNISASAITGLQVKVNFMGPNFSRQAWTWKIFNWSTNAYVTVGDNSAITPPLSWVNWTIFNFNVPGTLSNYVRSSDRQIRVHVSTNNNVDDSFIDYEAVIVTSSGQAVNVTVSPTSASVTTKATQQFAAMVTGSSNTAVTWQVNNVTGGNGTTGTVSTAGLYTAPATIPSPAAVTVKAIAQADTTKSAVATATVVSAGSGIPLPLHGVTIDDTNDVRTAAFLNQVITSLGNLSVTPTVRIVYTRSAPASGYLSATQQIKTNRYVLGMVVDSSSMPCYTVAQHSARWKDYLATMGNSVDVWEVGNEINGTWLFGNQGTGCKGTTQADVVTKMTDAYNQTKAAGRVTALTLFFNADSTCAPADPSMENWANTNVPASMKNGLDYVLVSFYSQWCTSHPYTYSPDWNTEFANLRGIFPNAKLGMGEIGWDSTLGQPSNANLTTLLQTDYKIHPTSVGSWAGGGFFWEFGIAAVPYDNTSGSIWSVVNNALPTQ